MMRLRLRSIRWTLTWWYTGLLAVLLSVFGVVLYVTVATNLARQVDEILRSEADGVSQAMSAFWEAERSSSQAGPGNWPHAPSGTLGEKILAGGLPDLIDRWDDTTGALATEQPICLLGTSGRILGVSSGFAQLTMPSLEGPVAAAQDGITSYKTVQAGAQRMRLITRPIKEGQYVRYIIQVATPLAPVDASLQRLALGIGIIVPAALLLVSVVGSVLATRALRPLQRMAGQARAIRAERLEKRLDVPPTGDELEQLAVTFNEALARIERSLRRMRQFSAAASHELRTPLTVMKGELEVALRKPRDAAEYQRVLQTHLAALNELAATVEELLTLARSEAGEGTVEWLPVELGALARRVRETLLPLAKTKQVRLTVQGSPAVWVRGERRLLERLVVNLADNALRVTSAQGEVCLRVTTQVHEASLGVHDTGPGIPAEELPHLFDRFFQRRAASDGERPGGLGLGLCRWIAEVHQGRLDVETQLGVGTTFTLSLPRTQPPA